MSQTNLFVVEKPEILEMHEHFFVSGPRSSARYVKGVWTEAKFSHSHPGGSVPHTHTQTGPSFYGYRKPKTTKSPVGEQMEAIPRSEDELGFDVIVTDSAMVSTVNDGLQPIGDTPIEALGFPAASAMMLGHRLKCNVIDMRTGKA